VDPEVKDDKPAENSKATDRPLKKSQPESDSSLIHAVRDITRAVGAGAAQGGDGVVGASSDLAIASKNPLFKESLQIAELIEKLGSKQDSKWKVAFNELFECVKRGSQANEQLMAAIKGDNPQIAARAWTVLSWRISPTHSLIRDFNLEPMKRKNEEVDREELIRRFVKARTRELERIREGTKLDDFDKTRIKKQIEELRSHVKD